MGDLIDRQAAIDMFQNMAYDDWNQGVATSWADAFSECAEMIRDLPSAQPEVIRCKNCRWWDKYNEKHGYCMAAKHGFMSSHWEISIYRTYGEDFFCADAEPKEKEGGDDE